jgi:outer membrane protein OmpA-like peptidoglycan-associated protein
MKNVAGLAIVSIFVLSFVISGCGKLSEEDFEAWKEPYITQNAQEHSELGNQVSTLDSKVDQQRTSLTESISTAKEESIASSEQGDADTISAAKDFATGEDTQVREDLTKTAVMVGEKAQEFAKGEDEKLRTMISDLEKHTKDQTANLTRVQAALTQQEEDLTATKAVASAKPRQIAAVQFASGKTDLNQAAKQELDKAIMEIQNRSDAMIVVKGHADGRPVLGGQYRSNWDLSEARAKAVKKYLTDKGVANTIKLRAVGHTEPIAPVNTSAGRSKNRRAEVVIYPAGTMM